MKSTNTTPGGLPRLILAILALTALLAGSARAIDIPVMTWTPRSDWINIKTDSRVSPHAVGDGATDDTAAIQSAFNILTNNPYNTSEKTIYFPAGTYKISSTLKIGSSTINVPQYNIIGCGLNTVIKWAGASGGDMMWPDGGNNYRLLGLVWDGNNIAGCGIAMHSDGGAYMTAIRHENESFRNFTVNGTYTAPDPNHVYPSGFPPSAIISGFSDSTAGETTILNCRFNNCTNAIYVPVEQFQNFMWLIDSCEFDSCGYGFNGGYTASGGSDFILMNSHFQGSTVDDIGTGGNIHASRLTSSGSAQFVYNSPGQADYRDCWVDSWSNTNAAMEFLYGEAISVVDCTFTDPPSGAQPPIFTSQNTGDLLSVFLSNNIATGFPAGSGVLHSYGGPTSLDVVPSGSMGSNLTSATETFLNSTTVNDSTHILDVTQSPYNVVPGFNGTTFNMDSTSAIQSAINAAASANNGSIVYLPGGFYGISSTLNLPAGNYTVEGEGAATQVCWDAGSNGTMMTVTNPTTTTVRQMQLSAAYNVSGASGYDSSYPASDPTTITSLKETSASGTSLVTYDNVLSTVFTYGNVGASNPSTNSPGLVLSNLPSTATVYIPVMSSPLTVSDSGQAKIYGKMGYMGLINVSGATNPKTGFLGFGVLEGGQGYGFSGGANNGVANITVNDNQNLLVGAYYSEEEGNDLSLLRGAGTSTGHVAIEGMSATSSATPSSTFVNVNNYAGRLYYGSSFIDDNWGNDPIEIQQTGSNPIDLMFAMNFFDASAPPTFTLSTAANLIATQNEYGIAGSSSYAMTDSPSPLTTANLTSLASSMDDLRQLGALNLAVQFGIVNPSGLVGYWKLDEPASPSADSSMTGDTGTWVNSPTSSTDTPPLIPYADPGSMSFNGSNQDVNLANVSTLPSGSAPRTLSAWAKLNTTTPGNYFIAGYGGASTNSAFIIGVESWGSYGNNVVDGGGWGNDLQSANSFNDGSWHLVTLTYDGTTERLYFDGQLKNSQAIALNTAPYSGGYSGSIGNLFAGIDYWPGEIDDVRVYNYALSATQVAALVAPASSQVVNVQFADGGDSPVLNGQAWTSTVSPLAYTGTTWTQTSNHGNVSATNLRYCTGAPSAIGFTLTGVTDFSTNDTWAYLPFLYETEWSTGNMTLTINGLSNTKTYDIYIPVAFNNGDGCNVTIGSQTLSTTGTNNATWASGINYVKFSAIAPASGSIVITLSPNGAGQNFSTLSGFQIAPH